MEFPPLHGKQFGGADPSGSPEWVGKFFFLPTSSTWQFSFLDENSQPVKELTGYGTNPRDAFEEVVQAYIFLNEGQESKLLKALLPTLRSFFNDNGGVKLEYM